MDKPQIRVRRVGEGKPLAKVVVRRISLSTKTDGNSRKCQTLRGPAVVEIGRDVKLLILSGEAEIVWDAPRSVFIGDVTAAEFLR